MQKLIEKVRFFIYKLSSLTGYLDNSNQNRFPCPGLLSTDSVLLCFSINSLHTINPSPGLVKVVRMVEEGSNTSETRIQRLKIFGTQHKITGNYFRYKE